MICTCDRVGFCEVHQRTVLPRAAAIWRGEVLTPEKCAAYRANWQRLAKAKRPPCERIGEERRREECPDCCGKVKLKVFACNVHGECTPETELPGVACCVSCGDYVATAALPFPDASPESPG